MGQHTIFFLAIVAANTIYTWKTDYMNGSRDPLGPYPRRGPARKPKVSKINLYIYRLFIETLEILKNCIRKILVMYRD